MTTRTVIHSRLVKVSACETVGGARLVMLFDEGDIFDIYTDWVQAKALEAAINIVLSPPPKPLEANMFEETDDGR
jgi:hypothetical protein